MKTNIINGSEVSRLSVAIHYPQRPEQQRTEQQLCTFVFNPQIVMQNGLTGHHYAVGSINQSWEAVIRRDGIRYRKAYQSRHTYACWSLAASANPNFIAKQIGHSDAQMVYRVYGSWMAEKNQDQIVILNQKLSAFAPSMPHAVGSDVNKQ